MDKKLFAQIVPGSSAEFDMVFQSNGLPFGLSLFTAGKLVFRNAAGVKTEITLAVPGTNPGSGVVRVTLTATQTASADTQWSNADVELSRADATNPLIVPLTGKFQILKRNIPAA